MPDAATPLDHAKIYGGIIATLENVIDGVKLGEFMGVLRSSDSDEGYILCDDDVFRLLERIGVFRHNISTQEKQNLAEEFVRKTSEAAGRSVSNISVLLRLYASGVYGIMPQPVCGSMPHCLKCGLTKFCDYFNSPRKNTSLSELPPAKRFLQDGMAALSDIESLGLIIGGMRATKVHFDAAVKLLEKYGTLRDVAEAPFAELKAMRDISESIAFRLSLTSEYIKRLSLERRRSGPVVRCGKDFYELYHEALRDLKKEVFVVVLLDQKNRVMKDEKVSMGTLTSSIVHPREVFSPAVKNSAASVAFIHNHPSGDTNPSKEDVALTKRLLKTAETIGIRVLDHVIIGDGAYTSFVDEGLM